ncbi:MAG: hypothetical protein ACREGD_03875 [Candidatus Saccharimonadales bacterium]
MTRHRVTNERDTSAPSWNDSTTVVRLIRDRMRVHGWATEPTRELPAVGPACKLEERPLDLGVGLWR